MYLRIINIIAQYIHHYHLSSEFTFLVKEKIKEPLQCTNTLLMKNKTKRVLQQKEPKLLYILPRNLQRE
jgi:hypothetical protein